MIQLSGIVANLLSQTQDLALPRGRFLTMRTTGRNFLLRRVNWDLGIVRLFDSESYPQFRICTNNQR
jgi:hypothetical protein